MPTSKKSFAINPVVHKVVKFLGSTQWIITDNQKSKVSGYSLIDQLTRCFGFSWINYLTKDGKSSFGGSNFAYCVSYALISTELIANLGFGNRFSNYQFRSFGNYSHFVSLKFLC